MTSRIPLAALAIAVLAPFVSGQDNYVNSWKSDVLLDRTSGLDTARRHKVAILVPVGTEDLGQRGDWRGFLKAGRPALEKSRGADFSLDFLPASASEGTCVADGRLAGDCAATAASMAGKAELVVLLHGLDVDTNSGMAMSPSTMPGAGIPGPSGAMGGMATGGMEMRNATDYALRGELVLAEAATGEVLLHVRNETNGTSVTDARGHYIKQAASQLNKLFDPAYGGRNLRNVLSAHPIGLILSAANFAMYQVTYERRLGDSRASLYWNPFLLVNDEDDEEFEHHIHYLLLPLAGARYYFREGGAGPWIGGKAGYYFFEFIDKPKPGSYTSSDTRWTKAHRGFLAGEFGLTLPAGRVRLHGSLAAGLAMGWKKAIEDDGTADSKDEKGFGVLPAFDLSLGVGMAF